jgi:hypothetical protein
MALEPASMCWLTGQLSAKRDGLSWSAEFKRLPSLEYVVSDAGTGLQKGIRLANVARESAGQSRFSHGLDVFHTKREGKKVIRQLYSKANQAIQTAEDWDQKVATARRAGQKLTGKATHAARAWRKAEQLLDSASQQQKAWQKICAALELLTFDGQLNTRAEAQRVIATGLATLRDPLWKKTKRLLEHPSALTFLDRLEARLAALELPSDVLNTILKLEHYRRRQDLLNSGDKLSAIHRSMQIVLYTALQKEDPNWREHVDSVRQILRDTWRASSLVEGLNSVARMHQSRHRKMTQGLLDLKRLYWNLRPFRTGHHRHGRCPYELLGLSVPQMSWWKLTKLTPDELRQTLSAQKDTS